MVERCCRGHFYYYRRLVLAREKFSTCGGIATGDPPTRRSTSTPVTRAAAEKNCGAVIVADRSGLAEAMLRSLHCMYVRIWYFSRASERPYSMVGSARSISGHSLSCGVYLRLFAFDDNNFIQWAPHHSLYSYHHPLSCTFYS